MPARNLPFFLGSMMLIEESNVARLHTARQPTVDVAQLPRDRSPRVMLTNQIAVTSAHDIPPQFPRRKMYFSFSFADSGTGLPRHLDRSDFFPIRKKNAQRGRGPKINVVNANDNDYREGSGPGLPGFRD